ncbi:hypothetical protein L7F22_067550 [Adiantum nelumboides]|nr:hypothetical protein [Adiantum nelumboides]
MFRVPDEFRRQASFMKGSHKFTKREGKAILVPTPPSKFALSRHPKYVVPDCEWKIPDIARCWALGNVYEEPIGEPVVDKEFDLGASTSFMYAVDDLNAMLTEHQNFEGGKTVEGGDRDIAKETTPSASNQGIHISKEDSVAEAEDPEMESTLQFVAMELRKKRKKQVEDEPSRNPKKY